MPDLSIHHAESLLTHWRGRQVHCTGLRRLHGGLVSSVWWLEFDCDPHRAVVKIDPLDAPKLHEARRIRYLRENSAFPCAGVYVHDDSGERVPFAFLLLEALPGQALSGLKLADQDRAEIDTHLAEILVELHSHTRAAFGEPWESGIATWSDILIARMREMRAHMPGKLDPPVIAQIDRAIDAAPGVLRDQGQPTLIHGDIWDGNILVDNREGRWRITGIVDPGTQYADVEMELAYFEVFGNRRPHFFDVYTAVRPLRPGYETRRLFYWLATGMIHVHLFAEEIFRTETVKTAGEICRGL